MLSKYQKKILPVGTWVEQKYKYLCFTTCKNHLSTITANNFDFNMYVLSLLLLSLGTSQAVVGLPSGRIQTRAALQLHAHVSQATHLGNGVYYVKDGTTMDANGRVSTVPHATCSGGMQAAVGNP